MILLETSLRLHDLITESQLRVLRECGHWVQLGRHDRFVTLVSQFVHEDLAAR